MTFNLVIEELINQFDDYLVPDPKHGYPVTNSKHPVYKAIVQDIPMYLAGKLNELGLENLEYIDFKGSTGNGKVGESFWIALLDKRITTSTTNGIYIVLLFDNTIKNVYLTVAAGTEKYGLKEIQRVSHGRREFFKKQINEHEKIKEFSTDDFYLGESDRARKFAASSCISKHYRTETLDLETLSRDIVALNEVYYSYLYEIYLENLEDGHADKKTTTSRKKRNVINTKTFDQLRIEQEKRNKEIGTLAEKFVFELEKQRLINQGKTDLANEVDWISQREDGHGYDIKSFFEDGSEKYIEVKGSSLVRTEFNFYLTRREKEIAEELSDSYVLVLVENVKTNQIRIFKEIINPIGSIDRLVPINYLATVNERS